MLAGALLACLAVAGCADTKGAYKVAATPDEYAFVVSAHYAALVNEAANIASQPATPVNVKNALKAADARAKPLVLKLRGLAANYTAVKTAESQEALQLALNQAVLAVADFIRELRRAQALSGSSTWEPAIGPDALLAGGVA
jgi:leucyl aminopeptidase (aminopeptidase T)